MSKSKSVSQKAEVIVNLGDSIRRFNVEYEWYKVSNGALILYNMVDGLGIEVGIYPVDKTIVNIIDKNENS